MRVILDTNLWSYIGDKGVSGDLERLFRALGVTVVMPPSTLVEVVQIPPAQPRQEIIRALMAGPRVRLPSEAQTECAEFVSEVRRCRPEWLLRFPNTAKVASLNGFWTNRVWRQAAENSERIHQYQLGQRPISELLTRGQRRTRADIVRSSVSVRPLSAVMVSATAEAAESYLQGWTGGPTEAWRVALRDYFWYQISVIGGRAVLTKEDATCVDWVGAYVDLKRLRQDPSDFTRLCLNDVSLSALRRNWLRWAVNTVQLTRKVTKGNPADEQHSSYLLDCDTFLSADVNFVKTLRDVREDAPFTVATPVLVSGEMDVPIVDRIEAALYGFQS